MLRRLRTHAPPAAALALLLLAPLAFARSLPVLPPARSVEAINTTELRMHLEFLASPEVGGRYTLAPGLKIAARYLASRLESYGLRGGGPGGSFFQPFEVLTTRVEAPKTTLSIATAAKKTSLSYGDFASFGDASGSASGGVVFAGYGVSAPALGHDDYAGLDVRGKIVFVVPGVPAGLDSSKIGETGDGEAAAHAHGAAALLSLAPFRYAQFFKTAAAREFIIARENVRLKGGASQSIPSAVLPPDAAEGLATALGTTVDKLYETAKKGEPLAPRALDATASLAVSVTATSQPTQNVVAILDGSDPSLRDEYVAISAHYDHLKTNDKGEIYPGADDDGSGTAAVLALARAFSIERPKRSILVVFHAGEELGLLGSEYNTDVAPAVPLDKIVADLNIDMIGRARPEGDSDPRDAELTDANSIYLIGADKISKELNAISEQTNADTAKLRLDYTYNDPNHPQQFYYRSDHWNYAKHGVPIIFYFSGVHADYHQTTDTVDKIDFEKMAKVARLVFATGWRVANLDHRLAKDAT
jgi:hypothetical protein